MQITQVEINNFRIFKEKLVIDITSYNSFVGKNGSGKTTILEAIAFATSRYFVNSKFEECDFSEDKQIKIIVTFDKAFLNKVPDGYNEVCIPCKQVVLIVNKRKQAGGGKALNDLCTITHFTVPLCYQTKTQIKNELLEPEWFENIPPSITHDKSNLEAEYRFIATRESGNTPKKLDSRSLDISNELDGYPNIFYFPKDRDKETKRGFNSLMTRILDDLNWRNIKTLDDSETIPLWENYYLNVIEKVENSKKSRIIAPLQKYLSDFFGEHYKNLELSLIEIRKPFTNGYFSLRSQGKSRQIGTTNLGSGEGITVAYYLLRIISELSKDDIIFLIDEPEIHLHPQAQNKLFNEIKSSTTQFIYSSHSDIFVDIREWKSIKRIHNGLCFPLSSTLNKRLGGKNIEEHLNELKTYYQDKSVLIRENNEMMFSNRCLFVEGIIDKYGHQLMAEKLNTNLDNCTIISCNGKDNIKLYATICLAFGIDFFIIYDQDNEGNDTLLETLSGGNCGYYTTCFEEALGVKTDKHKVSKVFERIKAITNPSDIPEEITTNIELLDVWVKNNIV